MKITCLRTLLTGVLALLALSGDPALAGPLTNAFTYQGRLNESGQPATGWYAMQFSLWDAAAGGRLLTQPLIEQRVAVTNGLFTVLLDFGVDALGRTPFRGEARWLEIGVDHYRGTNFLTLQPRQSFSPTPYALFAPWADSVPAAGVSGLLPDTSLSSNVALLDSSPSFNGTVTASNELRALRLQVGLLCEAGDTLTTVAGGLRNTNLGAHSFLGQGLTNTIRTNTVGAFLGGGAGNTIQPDADYAFLGGGWGNTIRTNADYSLLGGGLLNSVGGACATVLGGANNAALGDFSLAAGRRAKAQHQGAFAWADATDAEFLSTQANQFAVRANGGMYVEGSGGSSAPQLHLHQADAGGWARLRFSVAGVSNLWNISMEPDSTPDLRFSNQTNSIRFGVDGRVTAEAFAGDGSRLTGLNANALTAGTVPAAQLPDNLARLDAIQTFTSVNTFAHLTARDNSGPLGTGGSILVGSSSGTADPKLIRFGDSLVTIGEEGADDRLQLKAAVFAFLPTAGAGNVGIGKTNPATALDINGTATATAFKGGEINLYADNETNTLSLLSDYFGAGFLSVRNKSSSGKVIVDGHTGYGGGGVSVFGGNGTKTIEVLGTADASNTGGQMVFKQGDGTTSIQLDGEVGTGGGGWMGLYKGSGAAGITLAAQSPQGSLNGGKISVYGGNGAETIQVLGTADVANTGGQMLFMQGNGITSIQLDGEAGTGRGGWMGLYKGDGTVGITLAAQDANGESRVTAQVIEITGGSDLSERFEVQPAALVPAPGMVVCIDPDQPGQLAVSTRAYDRTVAGIISGAGGVKPGLLMGQHGSVADGKHPVALTGRAYCLAEADAGAIVPGDLLTTSDLPGHARKVTDFTKAQGAILGKAMTGLTQGQGLVLVLVTLQ